MSRDEKDEIRARIVKFTLMLDQAMMFAPHGEVAAILGRIHSDVASGLGIENAIEYHLSQTGWFADDGKIRPEIAGL